MENKILVVNAGFMSTIGKGSFVSILSYLFEKRQYKVNIMKFEPYLNHDAGLLNPIEHGETFVTPDGFECDNDLGSYSRYTNVKICKDNSVSLGLILQEVFEKERKGLYEGRTVMNNPHVLNHIIEKFDNMRKDCDIFIIEIGGVFSDQES